MTIPQMPQQPSSLTQKPTIGVLLVHGLNGDKSDMAELTAYLGANGMVAENMLLPGHGSRQMRNLLDMTWAQWAEAVLQARITNRQPMPNSRSTDALVKARISSGMRSP